jgi:hypothetical protein
VLVVRGSGGGYSGRYLLLFYIKKI